MKMKPISDSPDNSKDKKTTLPPLADIAIADDHSLVLEGLRSLISGMPGVGHIEGMNCGTQLLSRIKERSFSLYIIDIELPDIDGFDLIDQIRSLHPNAHFMVNTMHEEIWTVSKLLHYKVDAVVFKSSSSTLIREAIKAVLGGDTYFCPRFCRMMDRVRRRERWAVENPFQITGRELEVLKAIAAGLRSTEIAAKLFISENTVETHRRNLMTKLSARNSADMVMKAVERGLLEVGGNW